MKFKNISIKWRLFLYFTAFTAIILLVLWLFQIVFLDDFYKAIKVNTIKSSAKSIAQNIDNEDMDTLVTRISQSNDICILILDENNKTVASSDILRDCIIHKILPSETYALQQKAIENGGEYLKRFERGGAINGTYGNNIFIGRIPPRDDAMKESIIYTKIATTKSGSQYVIMLNSTISPISATVSTLTIQLLIITAILLLLSLTLAFFISKRLGKPIINLNNSAKILSTGDYHVQFDESGYTEIAELGKSLNFAVSELSKVENLRRELIANVSHDLRTPLTMIIGYGEVIRDLPNENTKENIQVVIDESKRLTNLVNDVLNLSRLQNENDLNIASFNLTKVISDAVDRYNKMLEKDGYQICFEYEDEAIVNADESKILQVIYNLVNNAITYTGDDQKVIIRQTIADQKVKIEVIDSGDGIESEMLPLIWDRYYKSAKSHKRAVMGSGLGLSIVKEILTKQGAAFGVISEIGKGSNFWFQINSCNLHIGNK